MESNSFLRSTQQFPFEHFPTEASSPALFSRAVLNAKPYKTQENYPLRSEIEEEFTEKLATMKQFYQMRLRNFEESITKLYQRLFDDELMKTLKKDSISSDFIYERVKELFQEILTSDKEILLTNITGQYAMLKHELRRVDAERNEVFIFFEFQ